MQGPVLPSAASRVFLPGAALAFMPSCGKRAQEADYLETNPMEKDTVWVFNSLKWFIWTCTNTSNAQAKALKYLRKGKGNVSCKPGFRLA